MLSTCRGVGVTQAGDVLTTNDLNLTILFNQAADIPTASTGGVTTTAGASTSSVGATVETGSDEVSSEESETVATDTAEAVPDVTFLTGPESVTQAFAAN